MKAFIEKNADDPNFWSQEYRNLLKIAYDNTEIFECLLLYPYDSSDFTNLVDTEKQPIQQRTDQYLSDTNFLHVACASKDHVKVKLLLQAGIDFHKPHPSKEERAFPIHYAASKGSQEIVTTLLRMLC